jgi:hypothetical protein
MAGMFAQEPPPDVEVTSWRQPRERPEVVAEVGLVVVAGATGEQRRRASLGIPSRLVDHVLPLTT